MPLTFADKGKAYKILKVQGKDKMRLHLQNLGFVENATISVISSINGNLIVEVKGVRVALDSKLANRIIV